MRQKCSRLGLRLPNWLAPFIAGASHSFRQLNQASWGIRQFPHKRILEGESYAQVETGYVVGVLVYVGGKRSIRSESHGHASRPSLGSGGQFVGKCPGDGTEARYPRFHYAAD